MIIIGITGTLGAGKGTAMEYLVKHHHFKHFSARGFITEEVKRRELPVNRDTMTLVANDLRKLHGSSYIVKNLYRQAVEHNTDAVIESIRNPGELTGLKETGNFYLLAIDADRETRYARIRERASETDLISFEKFCEDEEREMHSDDPSKQNIAAVMKLADYTITNASTVSELNVAIDEILEKIKSRDAHEN